MYYLKYRFNKRYASAICSNVYSKTRILLPDLKIYNNNEGFKLDITSTYKTNLQINYPFYNYIPYINYRTIIFGTCKCDNNLICSIYNIDKIIKWSDEEINILLNILNNEIIYVCLTK